MAEWLALLATKGELSRGRRLDLQCRKISRVQYNINLSEVLWKFGSYLKGSAYYKSHVYIKHIFLIPFC